MNITDRAERTIEATGAESLSDLVDSFGDNFDSVLNECNECWPGEDNQALAQDIIEVKSKAWYLFEFHGDQFS